jgi:(S)-3,5-dihydroxyphenylglycine transaminase
MSKTSDNTHVMNFLNEISLRYPGAISFASGRPSEKFFDECEWNRYKEIFIDYYSKKFEISNEKARLLLCQYGKTSGVINDLIAKSVSLDESIFCDEKDIVVTNGCQEALLLLMLSFLKSPKSVVISIDPTYTGFSALASVLNRNEFCSLSYENNAINFIVLENEIIETLKKENSIEVIYLNLDFNNPMSYSLDFDQRLQLLDLCNKYQIKIIEDNPYGIFSYTGQSPRTLKSLDKYNLVYYIGSFAKTICPALRVGYIVLPNDKADIQHDLNILKSLVSVNTSQNNQSVVGGLLLDNTFSLKTKLVKAIEHYKSNRDIVLSVLSERLSCQRGFNWVVPDGGFFLVIELPFDVLDEYVYECAEKHRVIFMPVKYFSTYPDRWVKHIRIAFSNIEGEELKIGVERLCNFLLEKNNSVYGSVPFINKKMEA